MSALLLLFKVPQIIQFNVLSDWLEPKELTNIDAALCNSFNRVMLLSVLRHDHFVISSNVINSNFVTWASLRGLKVRSFEWTNIADDEHNDELINLAGTKTNKIIYFPFKRTCKTLSSSAFVKLINSCERLTYLSYKENVLHGDIISQQFEDKVWTNMRHLNIQNAGYIAQTFAEKCENLHTLKMKTYHPLVPNENDILRILENKSKLVILTIKFQADFTITAAFASAIPILCPLLTSLSMLLCKVDSMAVAYIINSSPKLQYLQINTRDYIYTNNTTLKKKALNTHFYVNFEDIPLDVLEHVTDLSELTLYVFTLHSEKILKRLLLVLRTYTCLHVLTINEKNKNLNTVTDEKVSMLFHSCLTLQRINDTYRSDFLHLMTARMID